MVRKWYILPFFTPIFVPLLNRKAGLGLKQYAGS